MVSFTKQMTLWWRLRCMATLDLVILNSFNNYIAFIPRECCTAWNCIFVFPWHMWEDLARKPRNMKYHYSIGLQTGHCIGAWSWIHFIEKN